MRNNLVPEIPQANWQAYEAALVRLHRLIALGAGDAAEADTLREEMDEHARSLSLDQVREFDELSGDLYMISGQEIQEPLQPAQETAGAVTIEIRRAHSEHNWSQLVYWLRKPSNLTRLQIATFRAVAYQALGALNASRASSDYARSLEREPVATAR